MTGEKAESIDCVGINQADLEVGCTMMIGNMLI